MPKKLKTSQVLIPVISTLIVIVVCILSAIDFDKLQISSLFTQRPVLNKARLKYLFTQGPALYITMLMFLIWCGQIVRVASSEQFSLKRHLQRHYIGIGIAFLMACVVFLGVDIHFKVLSDETNILAISKSMFFDQTVFNQTEGLYYYGSFHPVAEKIPKRPIVFPFFGYLIHNLVGFRSGNLFVLNFVTLFSLFALLYHFFRSLFGIKSGIASILLVASYPVVTVYAASNGFDLFSTFFFFLSFAILYQFFKWPSKERFGLLLLTLVIFSNIRYESSIVLALVGLALLVYRRIGWGLITGNGFVLASIPWLFLPNFCQKVLPQNYENKKKSLLGLENFIDHFKDLIKSHFHLRYNFDKNLPYASLLSYLGCAALIYCIVVAILKYRKGEVEKRILQFSGVFLLCVLVVTSIFLAHFIGFSSRPANARFFMIISICFAIAPVVALGIHQRFRNSNLLLYVGVASFLIYHPRASEGEFSNALTLVRATVKVEEFIAQFPRGEALFVTERPGQITALNHSAITLRRAKKESRKYLRNLERGMYNKMIVIQKYKYIGNKPVEEKNDLREIYDLKLIKTFQYSGGSYVHISEVIPKEKKKKERINRIEERKKKLKRIGPNDFQVPRGKIPSMKGK